MIEAGCISSCIDSIFMKCTLFTCFYVWGRGSKGGSVGLFLFFWGGRGGVRAFVFDICVKDFFVVLFYVCVCFCVSCMCMDVCVDV